MAAKLSTPSGAMSGTAAEAPVKIEACGDVPEEEEEEEMEDMFVSTPLGMEWGGKHASLVCAAFLVSRSLSLSCFPRRAVLTNAFSLLPPGPMRGGRQQEPTRFGDWERKGRCTDF